MNTKKKTLAVLFGGHSSEYEVSPPIRRGGVEAVDTERFDLCPSASRKAETGITISAPTAPSPPERGWTIPCSSAPPPSRRAAVRRGFGNSTMASGCCGESILPSPCCMGRTARTARCRGFLSSPVSRSSGAARSPRRSAWTRTARTSSSPLPGSRCRSRSCSKRTRRRRGRRFWIHSPSRCS